MAPSFVFDFVTRKGKAQIFFIVLCIVGFCLLLGVELGLKKKVDSKTFKSLEIVSSLLLAGGFVGALAVHFAPDKYFGKEYARMNKEYKSF
jgi:uncharacterized membrane protein YfcA